MDCEFNLEWKLIPLPCAWAAFPPVGRRGIEREMERENRWRRGERQEIEMRELQKRRGNTGGEWREVRRERWGEKMEKAEEKRHGDTVYVIRGDRMAVGVVSCLD